MERWSYGGGSHFGWEHPLKDDADATDADCCSGVDLIFEMKRSERL